MNLALLKRVRMRRGLTQVELARRTGVPQEYISKVERGRHGCNPDAAQKLAEALKVNLEELQAPPEEGPGAPKVTNVPLHRDYLRLILTKEVGSSYVALSEGDLQYRCEPLSWEGVLEVLSLRRRELEYLSEELNDPDLPPKVRRFYKDVVRRAPDQSIRILAAARERETSEEGKEALTRTMRELL